MRKEEKNYSYFKMLPTCYTFIEGNSTELDFVKTPGLLLGMRRSDIGQFFPSAKLQSQNAAQFVSRF